MKKIDFNLDGMHRDTYGEGNRAYQLRKAHCDVYSKDGIELYFSYETLVAFKVPHYQLVSVENCWGNTTGKHLNWIGEPKDARLSFNDFKTIAKEYLEPYEGGKDLKLLKEGVLGGSAASDPLKTVGMVSALFDLICADDKEASVKYRKKFYKNVDGLFFPPDWDELTTQEKDERLTKVDSFAIKGDNNG